MDQPTKEIHLCPTTSRGRGAPEGWLRSPPEREYNRRREEDSDAGRRTVDATFHITTEGGANVVFTPTNAYYNTRHGNTAH